MDSQKFFEALLFSEHEQRVIDALDEAGYPLNDDSIWAPLGENEGNFSVVGNQQEKRCAGFHREGR